MIEVHPMKQYLFRYDFNIGELLPEVKVSFENALLCYFIRSEKGV